MRVFNFKSVFLTFFSIYVCCCFFNILGRKEILSWRHCRAFSKMRSPGKRRSLKNDAILSVMRPIFDSPAPWSVFDLMPTLKMKSLTWHWRHGSVNKLLKTHVHSCPNSGCCCFGWVALKHPVHCPFIQKTEARPGTWLSLSVAPYKSKSIY